MKCPSCGYDNQEDALYCSMCQGSFTKKTEPSPWMKRPSLHAVLDEDRHEPPVYSDREAWNAPSKTTAVSTIDSDVVCLSDVAKFLDLN